MMMFASVLVATVCLLAALAPGKVMARGRLAAGNDAYVPSSFSVNGPPMYLAAQPGRGEEVVLSRNRNRVINYDKLEQLVQELDQAQTPLENEINSQMSRDKKSKDTKESETAPLASHRRKNFFSKDSSADAVKSCPAQMGTQTSTIIDSKTSIDKGAVFIRTEYLELQAVKKSPTFAQEECKRLCCEDARCDTALLSMKLSTSMQYRCYLYQCNDLCEMVQHKDYYVFMMKDVEQSQAPPVEKPRPSSQSDITTGHDHGDAHNFDMGVDTFQNSPASKTPTAAGSDKLKLSDEDRAYFFDKSLASTSSVAMAVIILILGICLVLAFFGYLLANTRFIGKRIKWIGKKQGKNLDVEADYLINGMYL